jgi:Zn-dependent protease with chaperone function
MVVQFRLRTLVLITTAAALLLPGITTAMQQARLGNPHVRLLLAAIAFLIIPSLPFVGAVVGCRVSRHFEFDSDILGIAFGCFVGFSLAFALVATLGFVMF